ncbi:MAG: hypothetical protein WCO00_07955 [Rhodospirillaceae bacterium]
MNPSLKWIGGGFIILMLVGVVSGHNNIKQTDGPTDTRDHPATPTSSVRTAESQLSPEQFKNDCAQITGPMYDVKCRGKIVIWTGKIQSFAQDHLHALVNGAGFDLFPRGAVSDFIRKQNNPEFDVLSTIEFKGVIGDRNLFTPDIKQVEALRIVIPSSVGRAEQTAEDEKRSQEARVRREEREREESAKLQETANIYAIKWGVSQDAYLRANKLVLTAAHKCKDMASKRAQYDWESQGFLTHSDLDSWKLINEHEAVVLGNNLRMKNGFGVWKISRYTCKFNTQTDSVTLLSIE